MADKDSDILSLIDDDSDNKDVSLVITDDSHGTIEVLNNNVLHVVGKIEVQLPRDFILVSKNNVILCSPLEQDTCLLYSGFYCFIRKSGISLSRL